MKPLKNLSLVLLVLFAFTSCEKENLDNEIITESIFPLRMATSEFMELQISSKLGKETKYVDYGILNETEWYVKDHSGQIQYYELSEDLKTLHAKNSFSGVVIDFDTIEDNSRRLAVPRCSFTSSEGCDLSVTDGWFTTTLTVTCGSSSTVTNYPGGMSSGGGMAAIVCAAAAITAGIF